MKLAAALLMTVCQSPGVGCHPTEHVASFYHEDRGTTLRMCDAFANIMRQRNRAEDSAGRTLSVTYDCKDEDLIP